MLNSLIRAYRLQITGNGYKNLIIPVVEYMTSMSSTPNACVSLRVCGMTIVTLFLNTPEAFPRTVDLCTSHARVQSDDFVEDSGLQRSSR